MISYEDIYKRLLGDKNPKHVVSASDLVTRMLQDLYKKQEIDVTRAYLRFLEKGYTAKDLILRKGPMELVATGKHKYCVQQALSLRVKEKETPDDLCGVYSTDHCE